MVGAVMFAVAAFSMTNALSSFSTMVERTVPCPVVSELKVGTMFDLDLPQSSDCRIEFAVGHDADGDVAHNNLETGSRRPCTDNPLMPRIRIPRSFPDTDLSLLPEGCQM